MAKPVVAYGQSWSASTLLVIPNRNCKSCFQLASKCFVVAEKFAAVLAGIINKNPLEFGLHCLLRRKINWKALHAFEHKFKLKNFSQQRSQIKPSFVHKLDKNFVFSSRKMFREEDVYTLFKKWESSSLTCRDFIFSFERSSTFFIIEFSIYSRLEGRLGECVGWIYLAPSESEVSYQQTGTLPRSRFRFRN